MIAALATAAVVVAWALIVAEARSRKRAANSPDVQHARARGEELTR